MISTTIKIILFRQYLLSDSKIVLSNRERRLRHSWSVPENNKSEQGEAFLSCEFKTKALISKSNGWPEKETNQNHHPSLITLLHFEGQKSVQVQVFPWNIIQIFSNAVSAVLKGYLYIFVKWLHDIQNYCPPYPMTIPKLIVSKSYHQETARRNISPLLTSHFCYKVNFILWSLGSLGSWNSCRIFHRSRNGWENWPSVFGNWHDYKVPVS